LKELPQHLPNTEITFAQGFKEANKAQPASWLKRYKELPLDLFSRYGPFDAKRLLPVPKYVERRGVEDVYHGRRLLVGQGIRQGGMITARFETHRCSFRNSIHGVRLKGFRPWQEMVITGIYWSSLARYYYFMTSGAWGLWHDQLYMENVEEMPICFPKDARLRHRIVRIVEKLKGLDVQPRGPLFGGEAAQARLAELERHLDAAVFDLYELNTAERDLVAEMCGTGLDLFYRNQDSSALREVICPERGWGGLADLSRSEEGLSAYLRVFLQSWDKDLGPDGEFVWRVLSPPSGAPLLAVSFVTHYKKAPLPKAHEDDAEAWGNTLANLEQSSRVPVNSSRIFVDSFFRHVGDREILFIKRNEKRFWTRSAAREDAESAMTYLMNLENSALDGKG
jgi:hypothetical protein